MPHKVTREGMVIEGNPEAVTLHEAMSAVADWLDYEAEVVAEAADDLREEGETQLANKAEDQSESMAEAADALEEAAEDARETAAVAFSEEGEPATEIAAEESAEGAAVGGNPAPVPVERGAVVEGNPSFDLQGPYDIVKGEEGWGIMKQGDQYWLSLGRSIHGPYGSQEAAQAVLTVEEGNPSGSDKEKEHLLDPDPGHHLLAPHDVADHIRTHHRINAEQDMLEVDLEEFHEQLHDGLNWAVRGNPDPPPVPAGGNPPPQIDPQGAPPPAKTTVDIGPEIDHWYTRPLMGRR